MKRTVQMYFDTETKGAYRFRGENDDSPDDPLYLIGTLYLRKAALKAMGLKGQPGPIHVTVEIEEA